MSPSPDTNTASLLVVDDDLVTQARLNAYFSQEGYRVLLAGDGETFWQQLEHAAVDLVLLDINLPGQDGLSLARELRARDPAIGSILRRIRRRLLAHGVLMAFALVAIGDADWRLPLRRDAPPVRATPSAAP